jgi:hypothetical protein
MKLCELTDLMDAECICAGEAEREIHGGYCGDFLSFVMSRAPAGAAWFTVMSNVNVAAVAYMTDVGAVILCEGIRPDPALAERCAKEGIPLLSTTMDVYHAASRLALYENRL